MSPNSTHNHNSNLSRWSRIEFLRLAGEDLKSWLVKIEQFFSMEIIPMDERIGVGALQLEGAAIQCNLSFMKYRQYIQHATWNEYVMALVERFSTDFDDPMKEIKKIKHLGSVKEYQDVFKRNLTRVTLSQENSISCFIGGLKPELNIVVKISNPTTLSQVCKAVIMQEAYLSATRQTTPGQSTYMNPPKKYMEPMSYDRPILPNHNIGKVHRRRLCPEEMNERRAKGLCFFCDEIYIACHKCKNAKQLYLLELEEQEEIEQS